MLNLSLPRNIPLSTVSGCDFTIYLWIIKRIIFSIRDRRRRYAGAFLSRGWMGLAGLCRRFPRSVAHHRNATRLRITSSLRRTTSRWGPFDGHRYVCIDCYIVLSMYKNGSNTAALLNIPPLSDKRLIKKNVSYFNREISKYSHRKYRSGKYQAVAPFDTSIFNIISSLNIALYNW